MGILKEKKSNLDASWNKAGNKFCVGASSGNVYIGTFATEANLWVANSLNKKAEHKASVLNVKLDP